MTDFEELKGLHITSLDEEEGEEAEQEVAIDDDDDYDEDDDDYDEGDDEASDNVILGFAEKPENASSLLRHCFPSKAGGIPAWLDPVNLPSGRSCLCDACSEPLQFVLQVYAPEDKESTFHRTIFVFMCTSMACLRQDQHEQWKHHPEKPSRSVKVFRCQLPRTNPFYSNEKVDMAIATGVALCNWCGTWKGTKLCSSCGKALYCSEKHRLKHGQLGHEFDCQRVRISSSLSDSGQSKCQTTLTELQKVACITLWREYEIVQEDESAFYTQISEGDLPENLLVPSNQRSDTMMSLMEGFEGDDDKRSWASFEARIAVAPEQVLRYCRDAGAKPLWPMSTGRPSKDVIPKCKHCNGPLRFEFQILPQLLYYFRIRNDVESLDWAAIVVYTCEASCDGVAYNEEFAWVQLC